MVQGVLAFPEDCSLAGRVAPGKGGKKTPLREHQSRRISTNPVALMTIAAGPV